MPGFVPLGQNNTNSTPAPVTASAPQQNPAAILEALKAMAAKQSTSAQSASSVTAQASAGLNGLMGMQNAVPQTATPVNQGQSQNVNPLAAFLGGMNNGSQPQIPQNAPTNPLAALFPQQPQSPAVPSASTGPDAQAMIHLVQVLAAQGVPPDQWPAVIQAMQNQAGKGAMPAFPPPPIPGSNMYAQGMSRDRDGQPRSPPDSGRRRSRSPDYGRRNDQGRSGRPDSPGYDRYRNGSDSRNDRRGNDYRQRSPVGRRRRSPTPPNQTLPPPGEKFIEWDHNLPPDNIKVLSRTLFVGGVTSSEAHLRSLFGKYGIVQTCIVNVDKRHAFVKMINRKDAEAARIGMEEYRDGNTQLRVSSQTLLHNNS